VRKIRTGFAGTCCRAVLLGLGLTAAAVPPASALTISAGFVGASGDSFLNGAGATGVSTTVAGGGTLQAVFNTAVRYWTQAILSPRSVTIDYGWAAFAQKYSDVLAATFILTSKNSLYHYPPRYADIEFNSACSSDWSLFLDSTPTCNSEYSTFTASSADLGGGIVNTGRVFTGASGAAGGVDLLSVALHEIGHALGFIPSTGNPVVVANLLPNVGTRIPTTTGGHIDIETAVLYPWLASGTRKLLTGVDILGVAQLADYTSVDQNPVPVPLPGALVLMVSGLVALGGAAAGRRRAA